jgi:hypothetical protein
LQIRAFRATAVREKREPVGNIPFGAFVHQDFRKFSLRETLESLGTPMDTKKKSARSSRNGWLW